MADREKVFDTIRNCVTVPKCKDCPWDECEQFDCKKVSVPVNLLLDALKLLKEQEAKQVIDIVDSIEGMEVGYCPSCGRGIVNRKNDETKFCKFCGQAVTWNEQTI